MKTAIALSLALSASVVSAQAIQETDAQTLAEQADRSADEAIEAARRAEESLAYTPSKPYWTDGKWKITAAQSTCSMQGSQPFAIEYDDRLHKSRLFFFAPGAKSLKEGDKRSVKVAFVQKSPMNGWYADPNLDVIAVFDEGRTFLVGDTNKPMLEGLSRSDYIAFYTQQGVLIISIDLAGSGAAIRHLVQCAEHQQRLHPSDPFAR